jgi:hypothetical protein
MAGNSQTVSVRGKSNPPADTPSIAFSAAHAIEHRLTKPYTPKTNGMIERFNRRISEVLKSTHFRSAQELEQTLLGYARVYNHQIPQKALGHISPVEVLKHWQITRPELFKKSVCNLAGFDNYGSTCNGGSPIHIVLRRFASCE